MIDFGIFTNCWPSVFSHCHNNLGFAESVQAKKHSVNGICVEENALLMSRVRAVDLCPVTQCSIIGHSTQAQSFENVQYVAEWLVILLWLAFFCRIMQEWLGRRRHELTLDAFILVPSVLYICFEIVWNCALDNLSFLIPVFFVCR